jgi:hypothetical protein
MRTDLHINDSTWPVQVISCEPLLLCTTPPMRRRRGAGTSDVIDPARATFGDTESLDIAVAVVNERLGVDLATRKRRDVFNGVLERS